MKSLENHLELREVERSSNFFRFKLSPTARKMDLVLYPHINAILGSANRKSTCYMAARRYETSLRVLKNIAQRRSEIFFQHEKTNFVSPSGHVMFYLSYKHQ